MLEVKKIVHRFKLKVINSKKADLSREIDRPAIHRQGLELLDAAKITKGNHNVIGWGTKESKFLEKFSDKEREKILKKVLNNQSPLVILSIGVLPVVIETVLKVCNEFKIPLVVTDQHLADITMTVGWYIVKYLAQSTTIHGSLVVVNGVGVMIIGESGIGKSEAVLELVQKGSAFVSDDSVILKRIGTEFVGEPAELTKDFLEARGIGLINIPKIYGLRATKDSVNVDLVVELLPSKALNTVDRLGNQNLKYEVLDGTIPKVQIPVENGRALSSLIEAAVNVYTAKVHGHDPLEVISERNK